MNQSSIFSQQKSSPKKVALVIGYNPYNFKVDTFKSILGSSDYIDASNLLEHFETLIDRKSASTSLNELLEYLRSNDYRVTHIISLPVDSQNKLETTGIFKPEYINDVLEPGCVLIDLIEVYVDTPTVVNTSRTPSGNINSSGVPTKEINSSGLRVANIYFYESVVTTPETIVRKAVNGVASHFISTLNSKRNLSLLASPYLVTELIGDGEMVEFV